MFNQQRNTTSLSHRCIVFLGNLAGHGNFIGVSCHFWLVLKGEITFEPKYTSPIAVVVSNITGITRFFFWICVSQSLHADRLQAGPDGVPQSVSWQQLSHVPKKTEELCIEKYGLFSRDPYTPWKINIIQITHLERKMIFQTL